MFEKKIFYKIYFFHSSDALLFKAMSCFAMSSYYMALGCRILVLTYTNKKSVDIL